MTMMKVEDLMRQAGFTKQSVIDEYSGKVLRVVQIALAASHAATPMPQLDDKLATLRNAIEQGVKADSAQALKLMELVDAIGEQFKREVAEAAGSAADVCDAVAEQSRNSLFRSGAKICAGAIRSGAHPEFGIRTGLRFEVDFAGNWHPVPAHQFNGYRGLNKRRVLVAYDPDASEDTLADEANDYRAPER